MSLLTSTSDQQQYCRLEEIDPQLQRLVEQMNQKVSHQRDTKMTIIKSTRVYLEALLETLQSYWSIEKGSSQLTLQNLLEEIKALPSGSGTRLFVNLITNDEVTELNYICLAVEKYEYKGEMVVDFCLSSYDYTIQQSKRGNDTGIISSISRYLQSTSSLVSSSLMNCLSNATGGLMAMAADVVENVAEMKQFDSEKLYKSLLKACFLYELLVNGDVRFEGSQVYMAR